MPLEVGSEGANGNLPEAGQGRKKGKGWGHAPWRESWVRHF